LAVGAAFCFAIFGAHAQPAFVVHTSGDLSVQIGRDAFHPEENSYYYSTGSGAPETAFISGARNSGDVSSEMTQVAPYVLDGRYWAGTWTSTIEASAGAGGRFGLGVSGNYRGYWGFAIDGLSREEVSNTTFYYAAIWNTTPYEDFTPDYGITGGAGGIGRMLFSPDYVGYSEDALSGSYSGSFTPWSFAGSDYIGFGVHANANNLAHVNAGNGPSSVTFSYSIAFSLTPIDASVFSPAAPIPEPSTYAMLAVGLPVLFALRARRKPAQLAESLRHA
jgi:hypothetical protein